MQILRGFGRLSVCCTKKEGENNLPLFRYLLKVYNSAKEKAIVPRPVCEYGRIDHFSAAGTFPSIERPHEIIEFFCEHAAFAFRTIHQVTPPEI